MKEKIIVGNVYGQLRVLSITPYYKGVYKNYRCLVECLKCHTQSERDSYGVLHNKTGVCKKCSRKIGRPKGVDNRMFKDMTGQKFGKLTALRIDTNYVGNDCVHWIFRCDCGTEKSLPGKRVRDGSHTSCGCSKFDSGKRSHSWKGYEDISGKYWKLLMDNAKKRNLPFSLTIYKAWNIFCHQDKKCALSGVPLTLHRPKIASLDRIDSKKGYTEKNVQWVHKDINMMKMDLDEKDLFYWCKTITEYQNEKSTKTL